jgi:hypothetical protein
VIERLSRALGRPLAFSDDDRENVGITSLAHFVSAFDVEIEVDVEVEV